MKRKWLVRSCRVHPFKKPDEWLYWARFESEDCLTPGKEWESIRVGFLAGPRQGMRRLRAQVLGKEMTSAELVEVLMVRP